MPRSGQIWETSRLTVRPPLDPFRELLTELAAFEAFPTAEELSSWVDEARERQAPEAPPLRFVELRPRPRRTKRGKVQLGELYDARISCQGEVPCLAQSYHDLFNALMFKAFPRAKRALHARQYAALQGWTRTGEEHLPGKRTREQDALTLFDEGGSVVVCPTRLEAEVSAGGRLSLSRAGSEARLVIFGHALIEHLSEGQLGLRSTARTLFLPEVPTGPELLGVVDEFITRLVRDPLRFCAPDADAVVFFDGDESVSFRRFDARVRQSRTQAARPAMG